MRTHLRARTAQAGALLALVAGAVAGVPTAALAAAPSVKIDSVSDRTVASGSTVTIRYTVSNQGGEDENENGLVDITVQTSAGKCDDGCSPSETFEGSRSFETRLTAPTVAAGQKQTMTISVNAALGGENGNPASATVTVEGPAAPETVQRVSGRVKDDNGARVSGVKVAMRDSAGKTFNTSTDRSGNYSFSSSEAKPIAVGNITVAAAKDGYESASADVQGAAGRSVNVSLTIKKVAAASSSPTPSASPSPTAEVTEEPVDEGTEGDTAAPINDLNADNASNSEDEGTNWLLIIMGILLVAAGIGAMVLVWLRRKNADQLASETGIGKIPPATGGPAFDATRVAAPVGAPRGGDATMIAPAGGLAGGLGDAPTMIHRPVEDEFPDPYGAPLPAGGGFAGSNNQWGNEAGGNYGGAPQQQPYGQPQGGGYGAAQGGQPQRYDEHTNMYQPESQQPPQQQQRYDEHTNLYQPEPGGYPQQGGNYGAGGGYDQAGYDQHQQGGYDQAGWNGQDAGGYNAQGGYDQHQQGGGYGGGYGQPDGYDPQGGYPPQQPGGNYGPDGYDPNQQGWNGQQQPGSGTYGQQPRPHRGEWDD